MNDWIDSCDFLPGVTHYPLFQDGADLAGTSPGSLDGCGSDSFAGNAG
jgi:hypothetical protein